MIKGSNLDRQFRKKEARALFEELYDLVAIAYYPDHPLVLRAANMMINVLIDMKEYESAERFARICYDCLTKPIDIESIDVADAAEALAEATCIPIEHGGIGNIIEAEKLDRKTLRIKMFIYTCM
jgi:hypothetical protein